MKLTERQSNVIQRMVGGADIYFYHNKEGKLCFRSDSDGLKEVVYLTLTMRALFNKDVIYLDGSDGLVYLNELFEYSCEKSKCNMVNEANL